MEIYMNKLSKGLLAGAVLFISPFCQATVIQWSFDVSTEWTNAVFTSGNGTASFNDSLISWGTTGGDFNGPNLNRSALQLSNSPAGGIVTTNGGFEATNTITHYNNPVALTNRLLDTASLKTTLSLTPLLPVPGATLPFFETLFSINFVETPNSRPCNFPSATFCDDIFVLDAGELSTEFTYDDIIYTISIVELSGNLGLLPDATCARAGVANGCIGFTTPERAATPAQFAFAITTRIIDIPEPAILGMFGLGLLGLRAFGRRRLTVK
jgi:hypothetical protein